MTILPYQYQPAAYRPYDPESPAVASAVAALIGGGNNRVRVEHIGSSAVPGCAGKGYIDLLVLYAPGELDAARRAIDGLGFQRQRSRDPFPEERPMRVGVVKWKGRDYCVHAHLVASDAREAAELVCFRDRLRADSSLREAYEAEKRRILESGVTDGVDYSYAKHEFIEGVMAAKTRKHERE
jgi:GrpB-like predicted nucleotidyltransferase (UPF0157 family)